MSVLPGAWYHLKIMTLEGQDGGENRICAKIWNEQEKEPAEWSIDHSYSGTVSSGSFSVFSYHSGSQANSVLIGDISSSYYLRRRPAVRGYEAVLHFHRRNAAGGV